MFNLFGYSLIYYLPAAILSAIPSGFLQFLLFIAALGISCFFLFKNLTYLTTLENEAHKLLVLGLACWMNFMLAMFMKFTFYYHW